MADREKQIRRFQRAAVQRLTAAEFLLKHGFMLDAVYLGGYAVECSLKAMILRRTPRGEFEVMNERLTAAGAKGHDFEYLGTLLKGQMGGRAKRDREVLGPLAACLKDLFGWSTNLRYEATTVRPAEAKRFFRAVRELCDICARS